MFINTSKSLLFVSVLLFILTACANKNDVQKPSSVINIEGFDARDANGNVVGHFGPSDNDWQFFDTLSSVEMNLFLFNTNISLNHTKVSNVNSIAAYPNPCKNVVAFSSNGNDSVVFKIVITDSNLNILKQAAYKSTHINILIDLSDANLFPVESSRRIYYSLSAEGYKDYKVGYGDIKICDAIPQNYGLCF